MVVNLILDMKRLGYPSFAYLDEAGVRERAQALPEHGVPAEVFQVIARAHEARVSLV